MITVRRHGHRHHAGVPAVSVRTLPPGRLVDDAAARRPRPRALDRQAPRRAARRHGARRERGPRGRRDVHGRAALRGRRTQPHAVASRRERARDDPRNLHGAAVLVVDDEADSRELVKRVLEECEAVVCTAATAEEALDVSASRAIDLIVSDIGMPDMDGYALLREVRARWNGDGRSLVAVAVTAFARPEDRERALAAGYRAHLAKPFEPSEPSRSSRGSARRASAAPRSRAGRDRARPRSR